MAQQKISELFAQSRKHQYQIEELKRTKNEWRISLPQNPTHNFNHTPITNPWTEIDPKTSSRIFKQKRLDRLALRTSLEIQVDQATEEGPQAEEEQRAIRRDVAKDKAAIKVTRAREVGRGVVSAEDQHDDRRDELQDSH